MVHGGNGKPGSNLLNPWSCEGNGIMSYGSKQNPTSLFTNPFDHPNSWSTCSNSDFAKWYRSADGHCLRPGAGNGGGSEGRSLPDLNPELFAVILGCRMRENGHLGDGNHVPGYETPQGWGFLSGGPDDCAIACNHDPRCAAWTLHLP